MAAMAGKDGKIMLGEAKIGYIDNWSMAINRGAIETSQVGNDYKDFIAGPMDWSGSMSGTLDYEDEAQKKIVDSFEAGAGDIPVEGIFKQGKSLYHKGKLLMTSFSITGAHGDKVSFSCNFQGTGPLTKDTTQSGSGN